MTFENSKNHRNSKNDNVYGCSLCLPINWKKSPWTRRGNNNNSAIKDIVTGEYITENLTNHPCTRSILNKMAIQQNLTHGSTCAIMTSSFYPLNQLLFKSWWILLKLRVSWRWFYNRYSQCTGGVTRGKSLWIHIAITTLPFSSPRYPSFYSTGQFTWLDRFYPIHFPHQSPHNYVKLLYKKLTA